MDNDLSVLKLSIPALLVVAGLIALAWSVAGRIKFNSVDLPRISKWRRIAVFVLGALFVVLGINLAVPNQLSPTPPVSAVPEPTMSATVHLPTDNPGGTATQPPPTLHDWSGSITLYRWGDTVALCASEPTNLSNMRIVFQRRESYDLGDVFPGSAATSVNQCWCLQQPNPQFQLPPVCQNNSSSTQRKVGDWRNALITLSVDGQLLGKCDAQPDNLDVYQCLFRVSEQ